MSAWNERRMIKVKVFTFLGLAFNTVFFILFAVLILLFAFNIISPQMIFNSALAIRQSPNSTLIMALTSILIVLISASFAQSVAGKIQREKNIAFTTSSGDIVSIAMTAVEDLIKKSALQIAEIKNLRPDVVAKKKGIVVNLRLDLRSETNIPELTERLQELVKGKIRDLLTGIDKPVIVKIHVAKIVLSEDKKKSGSETKEPAIPFYGYGR